MKGSDKWGTGKGTKIPTSVLVVLILVATVGGVYFFYVETQRLSTPAGGAISTATTTGVDCNDPSMPQAAQAVEQSAAFTSAAGGLCFNYIGEAQGSMTFAYYNGTVSYPCGDAPVQTPAAEIRVLLNGSGSVSSVEQVNATEVGGAIGGCANTSLPIEVVSVQDVESTIPAVPQLNVTLSIPNDGRSASHLEAVLTLNGGGQTFDFGSVSQANPLQPGGSASSTEIVFASLTFNGGQVYPMTVTGTYLGGQSFSEVVHVQVTNVP